MEQHSYGKGSSSPNAQKKLKLLSRSHSQCMFKPEIFTTLKNYNRAQFSKDVMAGLIVGIVALPLAIAFAIASEYLPRKACIPL